MTIKNTEERIAKIRAGHRDFDVWFPRDDVGFLLAQLDGCRSTAEKTIDFMSAHLQAEKDRAQKAERALVDARECFACDEKLSGHVYCEADYDLATRQLTEAEQRAEKAERELSDVTQSSARVLERCLGAEQQRDKLTAALREIATINPGALNAFGAACEKVFAALQSAGVE